MKYKPGAATVTGSNVTEGSRLILACDLADVGVPAGTVRWQFQPTGGAVRDIAEQSRTHVVDKAERPDEGTYFCWGTNEIGNGAKGSLKVNVNVPPLIERDGWEDQQDVKEDEVFLT